MSTMSRRERDRLQRRAAANERIGRENAYALVYGGFWLKAAGAVVLALGVAWTWKHVDYRWVSAAVAAPGGVLLALYAGVMVKASTGVSRQMRLARGERTPVGWHAAGVAGAALLAAGVIIWASA